MEYRAYFLGNMYLSSIQQGIQAAHVVGDLFTKYEYRERTGTPRDSLYEWAKNHKTMILLNGGYGSVLREWVDFLAMNTQVTGMNTYPWTYFTESQDALDGAMTSVGIVLPEEVYDPYTFMDCEPIEENLADMPKFERELFLRLQRHGLAR